MRFLIFFLFLAAQGWGAIKTVCSGGCDYTSLDAAIAAAAAGDLVSITEAGTHAVKEAISGKTGLAIRNDSGGAVVVTPIDTYVLYITATQTDNVVIDGLTFDFGGAAIRGIYLNIASSGWEIKNCRFKNVAKEAIYITADVGITVRNCVFESFAGVDGQYIKDAYSTSLSVYDSAFYFDTTSTKMPIELGSGVVPTAINFDGCRFYGKTTSAAIMGFSAPTNALVASINNCIISSIDSAAGVAWAGYIRVTGTQGTLNVNNCIFTGTHEWALYANNTAGGKTTLNVSNSAFIGMRMNQANGGDAISTSNTPIVSVTNSYFANHANSNSSALTGMVPTDSFRKSEFDPMDAGFRAYAKPHGYIVIGLDDTEGDTEYQHNVVDVWKAAGVQGTLFVNPGSEGTDGIDLSADANWVALTASEYDGAREWGVHSWSHMDLSADVAFKIKMASADTATLTITENAFTIDCSNDAGDVSFDLTSEDYDALSTIYTVLADTYSAFYTVSDFVDAGPPINPRLQSTSMADVVAQAIPASGDAAYGVMLDLGAPDYRFFRDEIQDAKAWIVANTGADPADVFTASAPGNLVDGDVIAYFLAKEADPNVGILSNRAVPHPSYTMDGSGVDLRGINIYAIAHGNASYIVGASDGGARTEAEVRAYAASLAIFVRETGRVLCVYAHGQPQDIGTHAITPQEWAWFIDEVERVAPGTIKSHGQVTRIIRDSGTWTPDAVNAEVWEAAFTDAPDYHLKPNSVLINAGVDVGLTTDIEGKAIRGLPDIGAYEFQKTSGVTGKAFLIRNGRHR
jgi:hypothetical protein